MTDLDLDQIEARYNDWYGRGYNDIPLTDEDASTLYPNGDAYWETLSHYIVRNDLPALVAEVRRLREDLAYAVADAKRWHDAWQERGRIYEADTTALRAEVSRVREALQAAPTLAWMQATQPWTAPYSPEFERSKGDEPHRSLTHDLLHVTKAVGILASIAEWADHGSVRTERVDQAEFEGRIADLVMCALHMVNNPPKGYGRFDLQRAVVERVERVNGVEWSCSTVRALDAALDGNEASE